eukprot:TRINITY_DN31452_c0_g1_i1.p1 TRINITY_DN31452_c0_g1~~TRINITY_DN31452_c0_g1_i1.p1  ORF type:complete len:233 (+),score=36.11 TRINITY_DN31452_c0_g1_i1:30-728(+)
MGCSLLRGHVPDEAKQSTDEAKQSTVQEGKPAQSEAFPADSIGAGAAESPSTVDIDWAMIDRQTGKICASTGTPNTAEHQDDLTTEEIPVPDAELDAVSIGELNEAVLEERSAVFSLQGSHPADLQENPRSFNSWNNFDTDSMFSELGIQAPANARTHTGWVNTLEAFLHETQECPSSIREKVSKARKDNIKKAKRELFSSLVDDGYPQNAAFHVDSDDGSSADGVLSGSSQ